MCVWCFSKQKFSVIFHMFEASLFCTLSHRERFWGGLNLATFRIFLVTKILASRVCWYVCVCVCVVCLWNRVSCVVCSVGLLVSWFERPRNF